jgi:hypothetical protein
VIDLFSKRFALLAVFQDVVLVWVEFVVPFWGSGVIELLVFFIVAVFVYH